MTESSHKPNLPARRPALDDLNPVHAWLVMQMEAISPRKNEVTEYIEQLRRSLGGIVKGGLVSPFQDGGISGLLDREHRNTAVIEDANSWMNRPPAVRKRFLNCLVEAVKIAPLGGITKSVEAAANKFVEDDYSLSDQDENDLAFIRRISMLADMNGALHKIGIFGLAILAVTNIIPVSRKLGIPKKIY